MLQPLRHALGIDIDKPYGVLPVTVQSAPPPETAARPPAAPPCPVECASHSPKPAENPPLVFSSA
jgi:hypothetical protein